MTQSTGSADTQDLASTGAGKVTATAVAGLIAILAGAALTLLGRRRRQH